MSIRRVMILFVLTVAISLTHVTVVPALGVLGSFGTSGPGTLQGAEAIAVDANTGNVYVADTADSRIVKYDQSGNFILMFGQDVNETTGGNLCTQAEVEDPGVKAKCKVGVKGSGAGQFSEPRGVAVDPITGDVYVSDRENERVERFTAQGLYRSQIVSGQEGAPTFTLTSPTFATSSGNDSWVDTEGDLYISSLTEWREGWVYKFDSTGAYTGQVFTVPGNKEWENGPEAVVVDPSGTVYVSQRPSFGNGAVIKFSPSGTELEKFKPVEGVECPELAEPLAANLFNGEVFDAGRNSLCEGTVRVFDTSGRQVEEFLTAHPAYPSALAYGTSAGRLYELYGGEVAMYGTFPLPTQGPPSVSREDWSNLGLTSVTLKARLNPESLDTTYYFQYATRPDFSGATSIPAVPGNAGGGFLPVTESVNPTLLQQSTTYYYRLVAHNAFGGGAGTTVYGPTQTFTTLAPLPSVATDGADELAFDGATVTGTVIPESMGAASETMWCFQYGTTDTPAGVYDLGYLPGAPAGDAGQGTSPVAVSARLTRLESGTTYRYRLIAVNSLGLRQPSKACGTEGGHESDGAEGTFTTAATGPAPLAASGPLAALTQNVATLTGTVDPQGTRTTYDFQLGTDEHYGVDLFGEAGAGTESELVSVLVSTLQPGTTYHYRLIASSRYGTSYGVDMSFTTPVFPTAAISAPLTPQLLPPPPIKFPEAAKPLTNAQKLANALKACKKKTRKQRSSCERMAHRKYGTKPKKRK